MKIRLRVRRSPTESFDWEHPGPKIGIGKDGCELVFQGENSVSRRHAEIELLPGGAVLRDGGSKNGTYINGAPLAGTAPLAVRDEISLGLGGPRLQVLSIELAPLGVAPGPAAAPQETAAGNAVFGERRQPPFGAPASPVQTAAAASATTLPRTPEPLELRADVRDETRRKNVTAVGAAAALLTLTIAAAAFWNRSRSAEPDSSEAVATASSDAVSKNASSDADVEKQSLDVVVPPAPAPSPSPRPAPRPPGKPPEEIVLSAEPAIVWLGFEVNEKQFCYTTAWAIEPNLVVTTAVAADQLERLRQKTAPSDFGSAVLIARNAAGSVKIREMHAHSGYRASQPTDAESIAHNVSVGVLEGDLPAVCQPATDAEIGKLDVSSPLLVVGFVDESSGKEPFDKVKNLVRLEHKSVRIVGGDPPGAEWPANYRVKLGDADASAGPLESLPGSPVFNEQGRVVGVLTIVGRSFRMISLKNVRSWLSGF